MIILGNLIEIKDESKLSITWYHRVPLGLERNTSVYLALLPRPSEQATHNMAQVILTPINPWRWGDLWRIECKFHERPGVVAALLDILGREKINILFEESITTQQDRVHSVSIIADLTNFEDEEGSSFKRISQKDLGSLKNLADRISVECIENCFMESDNTPAVQITRMWDYYHAYFPFRESPAPVFNPGSITVKSHGEIEIYQPIVIEEIKKQLWGGDYPEQKERLRLKQVLLFTNTEERYISALFPDPTHNIAMYELIHEERIGALATLAKILKELNLNILSSFNRLVHMGTVAHWNVILDIGKNDSEIIKTEILKRVKAADSRLLIEIRERTILPFGKTFIV